MRALPGYDPGDFFVTRVSFLIDGFNVYHSLKEASKHLGLGGYGTRWLDLHSLCRSYLHLFGPKATLGGVYYFTAFAHHVKRPNVVKRHKDYISCLKHTGVQVELSRFKEKHTARIRILGGTLTSSSM